MDTCICKSKKVNLRVDKKGYNSGRRIALFVTLIVYSSIHYAQIIADHAVVEKYRDIPQEYVDEVKKMWLVIAGESHAEAYRRGLRMLEKQDPRYAVSIAESGIPESPTDRHLRASTATWGDLEHASGWIYDYGREDWIIGELARERTKAGITYCNTHNLEISVMGYGWCYDPMIKDVTEYLRTTEAYIAHCSKNNFPTRIIFTTGPVDGDSYTARGQGGNYGYSIYQRYETIRKHVAADPSRILFDYSDILSHDASGKQSRLTYNGRPYEVIAPSNLAGKTRGTHIGPEGDLRLAKAMWWLLARIAGWDGEEGGS